jgi:ABC-type lipoprotein export system ATPase subunit/GNAT superfamily N-acetyltransferase
LTLSFAFFEVLMIKQKLTEKKLYLATNHRHLDSFFEVKERLVRGNSREIRIKGGKKLEFRRFAPISRGDILSQEGENYWAKLPNSRGAVQLTPAWKCAANLPSLDCYNITIKEIETKEELDGYLKLTDFHYRGAGGVGRRVPLVAVIDCWELPKVIGFIELSSSFLVNTARNRILDAPFSDSETGVAWTRWDSKSAKDFGNSIVRISRCVVFPELRGIGLSTILVKIAVEYAKERWHIGGLRPSFIEITAEMLRYWPFVQSCGFRYVGETEGNQHRAAKDMKYLLGRTARSVGLPQGGGGILSMQRSYAYMLGEVMKNRNLSVTQIVNYLLRSPDKLTDEEWVQLHKVYRRPKPTYMRGLTKSATEFIERRKGIVGSSFIGSSFNSVSEKRKNRNNDPVLVIENFRLNVSCRPLASIRGRRVQEAFGIVATELSSVLMDQLNLTLRRGEVVLIGGPSGTGKSLLLRAIRNIAAQGSSRGRLPKTVQAKGHLKTTPVKIAWPKDVPQNKTPVELLGAFSLEESLKILAAAGLAEAQLFVRPAGTLSLGQSYRLALALAISEKPDVLLIDQFCELLDRFTAVAVCRNLRKASNNFGMGIITATADPNRVVDALKPDRLLLLSSSGQAQWISNVKGRMDETNQEGHHKR